MATNIKVFNTYELNNTLYRGSFPIYVSDILCEVETSEDFQSAIDAELAEISED